MPVDTLPELARQASLTVRFSEMDADGFSQDTDNRWQTIEEIKNVIQRNVAEGKLFPIDGARALASVSASLLGYEELHLGTGNPEMLSTLYGAVAQQVEES